MAENSQQPGHEDVVEGVGDHPRHELYAEEQKVGHIVDDPLREQLEERGRLRWQRKRRIPGVDRVYQSEHVFGGAGVEAHAAGKERLVQEADVGALLGLCLLLDLLLVFLYDGALPASGGVVLPLGLRLLQVVHSLL